MSMKLSYRDKVIIIVVSVIVVLGIGIFCFAKPKYESLQVSKERLSAKQTEQQQVFYDAALRHIVFDFCHVWIRPQARSSGTPSKVHRCRQ